MSAFLVEDKTINYVVNWLRREMDELYCIPPKLKKLGIDTTAAGWSEDLGRAMFQLNIKSVEARYGNGEAVRFRKLDYRYEVTQPVPLVQVLKSLRCWLYQCLEDIPDLSLSQPD